MPNGINGRVFLGQLWPWRICLYWYMTHIKVILEWWPWHVTPKHVWLNKMHVHAKYDVYFATMTYFKLTLKDDLDLDMSPLYMCVSFRNICMQNMKSLSVKVWKLLFFTHIFDLWPLIMTLTFYICGSMGFTYIPNMKTLIISCWKVKGYVKFVNFEFNWLMTLKDDLDKSPTQNMHPHEIHVQAKYEVSICNGTKVMALC